MLLHKSFGKCDLLTQQHWLNISKVKQLAKNSNIHFRAWFLLISQLRQISMSRTYISHQDILFLRISLVIGLSRNFSYSLYRIYSTYAPGVPLYFVQKSTIKASNSAVLRYYSWVCYYFILSCQYKLLLINNHSTLLLTFLCNNFVLPRQLWFKHAMPERHIISLLNNIQNFDRLMAI